MVLGDVMGAQLTDPASARHANRGRLNGSCVTNVNREPMTKARECLAPRSSRKMQFSTGTCRAQNLLRPRYRQPTLICKANNGVSRSEIRLLVRSEDGMRSIATILATQTNLRPGDVYCLYGDVGAGKSVFSRAFIRAVMEDPYLAVPSPTYLLQNIYDDMDVPIHHFDLYRLPAASSQHELARLDLPSSFARAVSLVEWAERLGAQVPPERLSIHIAVAQGQERMQGSNQQGGSASTKSGWSDASSDRDAEEGGMHADEEEYQDTRARHVSMHAHGALWEERLGMLLQELQTFQDPDVMVLPGPAGHL